ncbi:hypothetical protein BCY88_28765 [Paraburkholderia fungorum]|uniref:Uncharacterized protein n=1 Tax=Paraburkholderia fungorum TaxID=134537 RepID=A0A3R7ILP5_9BURK|nr:hypothetical protein BCY88_28765 [Paraburkholderia fungorum]
MIEWAIFGAIFRLAARGYSQNCANAPRGHVVRAQQARPRSAGVWRGSFFRGMSVSFLISVHSAVQELNSV